MVRFYTKRAKIMARFTKRTRKYNERTKIEPKCSVFPQNELKNGAVTKNTIITEGSMYTL